MTVVEAEAYKLRLWPVIVAFVVVFAFWIVNLGFGLYMAPNQRGTFGDMFGAVNSIFSGLAFVGVIYAIFMQRHEVALAKKEIKYTRKILDDQQKQLEFQNNEARKQAFESTFFQMLKLFSDITSQIDLVRSDSAGHYETKGKDVFPIFLSRLKKIYKTPATTMYGGENFLNSYKEFYRKHNSELGHYFRIIYNITKFIDSSDLANKKFYSNIVRAQLSDAEVAILFHNGLSPNGIEKFKPLMEKYNLLKNVVENDILDPKLKEQYAPSAFGSSNARVS